MSNKFIGSRVLLPAQVNRVSQDVDMVTVRVNYRFGGFGAPVAARY